MIQYSVPARLKSEFEVRRLLGAPPAQGMTECYFFRRSRTTTSIRAIS